MVLLSKVRLLVLPGRKITTSAVRNHILPNPRPAVDAFNAEPHGDKFIPVVKILGYIVVPGYSAYAWHHEYESKVLNRKRKPWPKYEWLNQKTCNYPFGDGDHTFFHHPYWNFLAGRGYETDPDGNMLPKGTYSEV